MNKERLFIPLLVIIVLPVVAMSLAAWAVTDLDVMDKKDARYRFLESRSVFGQIPPVLEVQTSGEIRVVVEQTDFSRPRANSLHILHWQEEAATLAYTKVPIWFRKLQGPLSRYILRSSGFDIGRLPLGSRQLELRGVSFLLDYTEANGNRSMLWIK